MLVEQALLLGCEQPHDGREVIFLVEVIENLAVVRVLYDDRLGVALTRKRRCRC